MVNASVAQPGPWYTLTLLPFFSWSRVESPRL